MTERIVECDLEGHIAFVSLEVDAFDEGRFRRICNEFCDFCDEISSKEEVRVLAIRLKGKMSFAKGEDVPEPLEMGAPSLADSVSAVEIPVIIGMEGYVLGQHLEFALVCDIRVATQESYFGFPDIEKGMIPFHGGTQRLPRLVGKAAALEMILTGDVIDARAGRRLGLVSRIVKKDELHSAIRNMAEEMSKQSPVSLRYSKEAVNKGMDLTLEQGIRLEADLYYLIHTTHDRSEGIRAFQEKRPPEFKGS